MLYFFQLSEAGRLLWWQKYSGVSLIHELLTGKYYYRIAGECQKMPTWGQAKRWISGWLQSMSNYNRYIIPKANSLAWVFVICPHSVHRIIGNKSFSVTPHKIPIFHLTSKETVRFPKYLHQEITRNYGILCSLITFNLLIKVEYFFTCICFFVYHYSSYQWDYSWFLEIKKKIQV